MFAGITTSEPAIGTPVDQFAELVQSELSLPVQNVLSAFTVIPDPNEKTSPASKLPERPVKSKVLPVPVIVVFPLPLPHTVPVIENVTVLSSSVFCPLSHSSKVSTVTVPFERLKSPRILKILSVVALLPVPRSKVPMDKV